MPACARRQDARDVIVALIGSPTRTNVDLAFAWRAAGVDARILWPHEALRALGPDDVAITRLDVLPTLDGVEPGLELVDELARRGVRVLNRPPALLAVHDKLLTRDRLVAAGLPHPRTAHVVPEGGREDVELPCVLKPRFGSWGQDVLLCRTREDLERSLELLGARPWFRKHGAIAQELVERVDADLRLVVAGDRIVAAGRRVAGPREWRTNVTLGGRVVRAELPEGTSELALAAARAVGIDLAGVDLLPIDGGWTILELNGAVDYDRRYTLPGLDPYLAILDGLGIPHGPSVAGTLEGEREKEVDMTKTAHGKPARPGDEIVIAGHSVGETPKTAVILEVLGEPDHVRFRVRWEDGHESIYFPGDDAIIRRPEPRARAKART
jgi:RimK family alpha-L-glutamate ligase